MTWQWQSGNSNGHDLAQIGSIQFNLAPCALKVKVIS
jgi:hypothetical protein